MLKLIQILVTIARIIVAFRFSYLLYQTQANPEDYKIDCLYWFVCYMIGDIWFILLNREYSLEKQIEGDEDQKNEEN